MTEVTIREQMMRMTSRAMAIPFQFLCGGALPTRSWKIIYHIILHWEYNITLTRKIIKWFGDLEMWRSNDLSPQDGSTVLKKNEDLQVMSFISKWMHSNLEPILSYIRQMYFVLSQLGPEIGQRTAHSLSDRCRQLSHLYAITLHPPAAPHCSHTKSPCSFAR